MSEINPRPTAPLNIKVVHKIDRAEFEYLAALWAKFAADNPDDPAVKGRKGSNPYFEVLGRAQ